MNRLRCRPQANKETIIQIGSGVACDLSASISSVPSLGPDRPVFVLYDEVVRGLLAGRVPDHWPRLGLEGGEGCKTLSCLEQILRELARQQVERRAILVSIGGGTVGDVGGLAASLYLRGISSVQVPTTLLAMLDSSVGGKTAVNIPEGKNLVGTFWPPELMLADVQMLKGLPRQDLLSGLGEALKMGIGFSEELFVLLEQNREAICEGDEELLVQIVTLAVQAKIDTVEADPREETGRRRCLNLGHTLGHALEAQADFEILHGFAVAQGLHFAIEVSKRQALIGTLEAKRCLDLLEAYGFEAGVLPDGAKLLPYFERDKKMEKGMLHMVLPTGIGSCRTVPMAPGELVQS